MNSPHSGAPDELVRELSELWCAELGLASVDPDDDFFAVGGDSLGAYAVLAEIADRFDVVLPEGAVFEDRTVARQAARLTSLVPASAAPTPSAPAPSGEAPQGAPLWGRQRDIAGLHALGAGHALHILTVLRATEPIDEARLRRALQDVLCQHESLRTVLDGERTRIRDDLGVARLETVELDAEAVPAWVRAERARPFHLEEGPLWRTTLMRSGCDRLVLTAHHLIADGASLRTVADDLARAYCGRPPAPRAMQFGRYRRIRVERATPDAMAEHERYWLRATRLEFPPLELPSDGPRPGAGDLAVATHSSIIGGPARAALQRTARATGGTLFTVLFAACTAVLHRFTGQRDLVLGFAADGRHVPGSARVVGDCGTVLPVRSTATGSPTVAEWAQSVQRATWGALAHQDVTPAMLLERTSAPVDPFRPLLVSATMNYQRLPRDIEPFEVDLDLQVGSVGAGLLDLEIMALDGGEEIRLDLVHRPGVDAARLAGCLHALLDGMADPHARVHELPIVTPRDERLLLEHWGRGPDPAPPAGRVDELIAAQAARAPDAVAVRDPGGEASYRELDAAATGLANALRVAGACPGDVAALLATRDARFPAVLVGVLRAGCVYLPLDPRDPDDRLRNILERSKAAFLVTGRGLEPAAARLADGLAVPPVVVRAADPPPRAHEPLQPPAPHATEAAYVIYTSGSTGDPKGVVVGHDGLVNHLQAKVTALGLTGADVVAQTASQCFDISVWQCLAPLVVGGSVRVVPDEDATDAAALLRSLGLVTVLEVVPATLRALLDDEAQRTAPRPQILRWLMSTGEPLPPELCRRWMSRYPEVPVMNAYGPTECSDDVTHAVIEWPPESRAPRVPIGRPIPGARLQVLDGWGGLAPPGAPGELHVGGVCVGLGYLDEPERTARAFVPDPSAPGQVLYRTGDLVRFRADGELEFLGRADGQQKVNGIRVEPGEVEAVLGTHPEVAECAVAVRRDAAGAPALAGYVVRPAGAAASARELRHHVRTRLPHYLVPASITWVDAIPRTRGGKVDRAALPDPAPRTEPAERVAPRTRAERAVAEVWRDVLRVRDVGAHDDFFELGGQSQDAAVLAVRLRGRFGVDVPVFQIFREPSLAAVARFVERAGASDGERAWT